MYEALACGAALVTDSWNVGLDGAPCLKFGDVGELERALDAAVRVDQRRQEDGLRWARNRSPAKQWSRVLDAVKRACPPTVASRAARREWLREMEEKAASAPLTNDGRPVILV